MKWMPIETAPKDDRENFSDPNSIEPNKILMAFGSEGIAIVYWDWSYAEGGYNNTGQLDGWVVDRTGEASYLHFSSSPTYWMDLPSMPN